MWALVKNNQVTQVYTRPKAITIGENQYPSNIMSVWSAEDLEAIGIYEVVVDNSNFKNPSYYINTNQSFDFADGVVTASYGVATAKPLDDITDEDGNVTRGLKYNHKQIINSQAGGLLQGTDWMVVRASEGGTAVPSDIATWRAAVRTKSNDMCAMIDGVADVDALAALYVYNDAEPPVRPLGEFPALPE